MFAIPSHSTLCSTHETQIFLDQQTEFSTVLTLRSCANTFVQLLLLSIQLLLREPTTKASATIKPIKHGGLLKSISCLYDLWFFNSASSHLLFSLSLSHESTTKHNKRMNFFLKYLHPHEMLRKKADVGKKQFLSFVLE